jgi:hypothetical protein
MQSLPDVLQQQGLGQLQVTLQGLSTFRNQVSMCSCCVKSHPTHSVPQVLYLHVLPGPDQEQLQCFGNAVIVATSIVQNPDSKSQSASVAAGVVLRCTAWPCPGAAAALWQCRDRCCRYSPKF